MAAGDIGEGRATPTRRRWALIVGGSFATGFAIAALFATAGPDGGEGGSTAAAPAPSLSREQLRSLSPQLAAHVDQANQIIASNLEEKLGELQGVPVVLNQWSSWCPPCRAELPLLAGSAEEHLAQIAFLGIDVEDELSAATEFLVQHPTPYPHVFDEDASSIQELDWDYFSPTTWLMDESGEVVEQHRGPYVSVEQLEADIDRYLLGG